MSYRDFFTALTGHPPLPYQERLAEGDWPQVIDVPTGLGKTAAVTVAWLWKRLSEDAHTGRRLIYCLPMRVLVEQTRQAAQAWCEKAEQYFNERQRELPTVHVLMGGDQDESWEAHPERSAIIIGTQDMLLSRALNRGYAMSRYRWPMHFALLNNDCTWVLDETQLMGVAIETTAQLQAFRARLGSLGTTHTVWMSATLGQKQLNTVDHPEPEGGWRTLRIDAADRDHPLVLRRLAGRKPVARGEQVLNAAAAPTYAAALAAQIHERHARRGGLTLVVLNRVSRAQEVYAALRQLRGKEGLALVHSRFRPPDRRRHEALLHGDGDRIVVATQAVEAGVDVSARTLFTELAPWPSMVQRFGRCNRYGEQDQAEIVWVDIEAENDASLALPYEPAELAVARSLLSDLASASPAQLAKVSYEPPAVTRHVLRRRDLLELFDTTPDLLGDDLDISRFVRDGRNTDVQIFWRDIEGPPADDVAAPQREELCRVGVGNAFKLLTKLSKAKGTESPALWEWDPLERNWRKAHRVFPGQVLLLPAKAGAYDTELGWTGILGTPVDALPQGDETLQGLDSDQRSSLPGGPWVELRAHLGHVEAEARHLGGALLGLDPLHVERVAIAGRWHDVGKAHPEFQRRLTEPVKDDPAHRPPREGVWAKSNHRKRWDASPRPYFRHELASALAWLTHGQAQDEGELNLVAYLVAAHHGKVRLSIRSIPGEAEPPAPTDPQALPLFARGVWHGDVLADFELPDGTRLEGVELDLRVMQLGEGSWLERMLALRDDPDLGPFRLALLETVVRVADWRASQKEQERRYDDL